MNKALAIVAKEINVDVLDYYSKLSDLTPIYLVTPKKNASLEIKFPKLIIIEDSKILNRSDYPDIENTSRPNWYYQQFLKYKLVLFLSYDYIHIVDGDSFISESILFDEKNLFHTKKKIEKKYNSFIRKLNIFSNDITEKSFITNQMIYSKENLKSMFNKLLLTDNSWIDFFIELLVNDKTIWFSEYQLYANYLIEYQKEVEQKQIKIYRRLDLISTSIHNSLRKYDIVSFEYGHKSSLIRKFRARVYYSLGINFG